MKGSGACWRVKFEQRIAELRQDPAIREFLGFLHSCNPQGLPDIAALLGKEFYELDRALQRSQASTAEAVVDNRLVAFAGPATDEILEVSQYKQSNGETANGSLKQL